MAHTHKTIHRRVKHFERPLALAFLSLSCIALLSAGVFFLTKGSTPASSELSFIEHSIVGKSAGSVIPASCESGYLDSYDDQTTLADFKCYSTYNTGDTVDHNYEGTIFQKTSAEANTICWNITGGGQGGIDYVYEFVPGSASCPATPTVNLFFSFK
jgi:hypothetical protein